MSQGKNNLKPNEATICLVNYKTETLTKLCLRGIRRHTDYPYRVVVVDNDSGDASLDYLRSLSWITLVERPGEVVKSGSWAHGTALDIGLSHADTEYFVALHSDTLIHKRGWLRDLITKMEGAGDIACCGSGKLDLKPRWRVLLKQCTDIKKWVKRARSSKRDDFYIRAICAIYKTSILRMEDLGFAMNVDEGVTCGKQLYYELLDRGYDTLILPDYEMGRYVHHLAHATMVLNPEFTVRKRTERKCRERLRRILESDLARTILNDDTLDH